MLGDVQFSRARVEQVQLNITGCLLYVLDTFGAVSGHWLARAEPPQLPLHPDGSDRQRGGERAQALPLSPGVMDGVLLDRAVERKPGL